MGKGRLVVLLLICSTLIADGSRIIRLQDFEAARLRELLEKVDEAQHALDEANNAYNAEVSAMQSRRNLVYCSTTEFGVTIIRDLPCYQLSPDQGRLVEQQR